MKPSKKRNKRKRDVFKMDAISPSVEVLEFDHKQNIKVLKCFVKIYKAGADKKVLDRSLELLLLPPILKLEKRP